VRQLDRQIGSQFYKRTALSRDKATMLTKSATPKPEDTVTIGLHRCSRLIAGVILV
jgi:predicted nuclease of restriction endonuclease-like (RecB) superfamily